MNSVVFNNAVSEMLDNPKVSHYEILANALTAVMSCNGRDYTLSDCVAQRWSNPLKSYYSLPTWAMLKHDLEVVSKGRLETILKTLPLGDPEEDLRVRQLAIKAKIDSDELAEAMLLKGASELGFKPSSKNHTRFLEEKREFYKDQAKEQAVLNARWGINTLKRQQENALDSRQTREWVHALNHFEEVVKDLKAIGANESLISGYSMVVQQYRSNLRGVEDRYEVRSPCLKSTLSLFLWVL